MSVREDKRKILVLRHMVFANVWNDLEGEMDEARFTRGYSDDMQSLIRKAIEELIHDELLTVKQNGSFVIPRGLL